MTTLINLTGREIVIVDDDGRERLVLPPSKQSKARVGIEAELQGEVRDGEVGVDIVRYCYDRVTGLPPARPGIIYVVGWAVLQALNGTRPDVVAPDTTPGSVVRGERGAVQGVKRFRRA